MKDFFLNEPEGFSNLNGVRLIGKSEDTVVVEFSIPPGNLYFDGHFPDFSLLPALAQIELAVRFSSLHFGTGVHVRDMRRVKFTRYIRPDVPLRLKLKKDEENISFKILSPGEDEVYSTGNLTIISGGEGS